MDNGNGHYDAVLIVVSKITAWGALEDLNGCNRFCVLFGKTKKYTNLIGS